MCMVFEKLIEEDRQLLERTGKKWGGIYKCPTEHSDLLVHSDFTD
jgi:hypothetical protein